MNTNQLLYALSSNLWQPHFYSVTQIDALPLIDEVFYPAAIVINTLKKTQSNGGHWQIIYIEAADMAAEFFCSFGLEMNTLVKQFLFKLGHQSTTHKNMWIQSPVSISCGLFCLDYAVFRSLGGQREAYYSRFRQYDFDYNEDELSRNWSGRMTRFRYKFV